MADEIFVDNGDVTLRVEVAGDGPVVLCVHGWPELASSWHHQVRHLAERGYRAAAMDVRGYGGSSAPPEIERYRLAELASDVAAVAAALDDGPIVLAGHDWGAPIVWNTALRHPDRVRAVAGLSVPYNPPLPMSLLDLFDQLYADKFFYQLYFAKPGRAEADFAVDLRAALKRSFFALSGDAPAGAFIPDAPRDADFLPLLPEPPAGPLSFLSDEALDTYAATFERTGMTGAFNRYRAAPFDAADAADLAERDHRPAVLLHRWLARPGAPHDPRRRHVRRPRRRLHRLPRQDDHRRRRPLGAPGGTRRGQRRPRRLPRLATVVLTAVLRRQRHG